MQSHGVRGRQSGRPKGLLSGSVVTLGASHCELISHYGAAAAVLAVVFMLPCRCCSEPCWSDTLLGPEPVVALLSGQMISGAKKKLFCCVSSPAVGGDREPASVPFSQRACSIAATDFDITIRGR